MLETIAAVMEHLSEEDLGEIAKLEKHELIDLHLDLGMWIRNEFDLWSNEALLKSCVSLCADEASSKIIFEVWKRACQRLE